MILIGLAGIVVPFLPGLLLIWAGVLVWALAHPSVTGWVALGVASGITAIGWAVTLVLPGRRLRASGVPWITIAVGSAAGIAGFFVIPVVGLFLGFVVGVYLAERVRLTDHGAAWTSSRAALTAVGWSIAIELATGLLVTATWVIAVITA